jgi:hypothetical protein
VSPEQRITCHGFPWADEAEKDESSTEIRRKGILRLPITPPFMFTLDHRTGVLQYSTHHISRKMQKEMNGRR